MNPTELLSLSADPRSLDPTTIRQVIREHGIQNTREADDLTVFLDCVTVRRLLADGETARAELCAHQLGYTLSDFAPAAPGAARR
jgi:hypothetical protein